MPHKPRVTAPGGCYRGSITVAAMTVFGATLPSAQRSFE
jgi:hypothetical protein